MNIKVLTDEQKAKFVSNIVENGTGFIYPLFVVIESIEQATLQSEQVQAWKRDAERYRYIKDGGQWVVAATQTGCQMSGQELDDLIDSEMEQQR